MASWGKSTLGLLGSSNPPIGAYSRQCLVPDAGKTGWGDRGKVERNKIQICSTVLEHLGKRVVQELSLLYVCAHALVWHQKPLKTSLNNPNN